MVVMFWLSRHGNSKFFVRIPGMSDLQSNSLHRATSSLWVGRHYIGD